MSHLINWWSQEILESWNTLCDAAEIRHFDPITKLTRATLSAVPNVLYHRECRSGFTHNKELTRLQNLIRRPELVRTEGEQTEPRQSLRQLGTEEKARVYDKVCIFCECKTKYVKGTHSRESLIQAVDLRADQTIRDIAINTANERLLAVTSRDIVAAEAHYHHSCYKLFTRKIDSKCDDKTENNILNESLNLLFEYIRTDIFLDPRIVPLTDLTSKLESIILDTKHTNRASNVWK